MINRVNTYSQDKIDEMNSWLKTVSTISTENVSLSIESEFMTILDEEKYNVVVYNDGRVDRNLSSRETPSIMLKHIESIFNGWGISLDIPRTKESIDNRKYLFHFMSIGGSRFIIGVNSYHRSMYSLSQSNNWLEYNKYTIETILDEFITNNAYKRDSILNREIKIRKILENDSL